jgi:P2 family phage contractile tail tube protein
MPVNSILRKFVVFVDGFGKLGDCEAATLPTLTLKTEEFRGGGMDTPIEIDLGTERLEFQFTMTAIDEQVIEQWGLFPGQSKAFTLRGSLVNHLNGESNRVVCNMRGVIKEIDFREFTPGDKATVDFTVALDYYKLSKGDRVMIEIDIENVRRVVGGIDQLEADRFQLGL